MFKKNEKMPKTQYLCGFSACISKGRAGQVVRVKKIRAEKPRFSSVFLVFSPFFSIFQKTKKR